jgi:hypothetical protein
MARAEVCVHQSSIKIDSGHHQHPLPIDCNVGEELEMAFRPNIGSRPQKTGCDGRKRIPGYLPSLRPHVTKPHLELLTPTCENS